MDNQKIGNFISELRKEKGLTQKALAEKLNVTDKAVSKWERGIGYPEITNIPLLAEILDVSVSALLLGERISSDEKKETKAIDITKADIIVTDTIEYAKQSNEYKTSRIKRIALTSMTLTFLLAIFVCMLCNYVISRTFDWSLYVVGGQIVVWLLVFPFLAMKHHRCVTALLGLTITTMPFLLLVEHLCPIKDWAFSLALPIVIISLVSLWITVILFVYTRFNRFYLISLVLFVYGIIVNPITNGIISRYLGKSNVLSTMINALSLVFAAIVLAIIGYSRKKAKLK